ncbi:hypothetical protein D7X74_42500 [Corallococcus sp. CA047B]|nr:hypothetical protein D7X74_42500 [Corallococcus sp. CA047B]
MGRLLWCLGDRGLKTGRFCVDCVGGVSLVSSPAGADSLSLSCQRKSAQSSNRRVKSSGRRA